MLDGAVMVNVLGGTAGSMANTTLGVEGIQEWRVITNTLSAEYGMTMGSQMTIVTKSGTNSFHGSAFEYVRNSKFGRTQLLRLQDGTDPRQAAVQAQQLRRIVRPALSRATSCFSSAHMSAPEELGITSVAPTIPAECRTEPLPSGLPHRRPDDDCANHQAAARAVPASNLAGEPCERFITPSDRRRLFSEDGWTGNISAADTAFGRFTRDTTT
jgi:hypothetical protein